LEITKEGQEKAKEIGKEIIEKIPKDMGFKETVKDLPCRVVSLLHKFIGWKGLIVSGTIWIGKLSLIAPEFFGWVWVVIAMMVIFDKKALDVIKEIKR